MRKKKGFQEFLREEDGMGTVEVILIIVVLVGLVILFKSQITTHRLQLANYNLYITNCKSQIISL